MSERGQASVEWIATLLVVAIALTALAGLAGRLHGEEVATAALRTTTCAAAGDCERSGRQATRRKAVTPPPLIPVVPGERAERRPRKIPRLPPGLRRRAGALWRRAWLACFGYERGRYAVVAPESRMRHTVPVSEAVRMVNDCVSPVDLVRDWELLTGR